MTAPVSGIQPKHPAKHEPRPPHPLCLDIHRGSARHHRVENHGILPNRFGGPAVRRVGIAGQSGGRDDGAGDADHCGAAGRRRSCLRPQQGGVFFQRRGRFADFGGGAEHRLHRGAAPVPSPSARTSRRRPGRLGGGVVDQPRGGPAAAAGRQKTPLDHPRGQRPITCSPTCGPRWACWPAWPRWL